MSNSSMTVLRVSSVNTTFKMERIKMLRKSQSILNDLIQNTDNLDKQDIYALSLKKVSEEISRLTAHSASSVS